MIRALLMLVVALVLSAMPAAVLATTGQTELLDTLPAQPIEPITAEMRQIIAEASKNPQDVDVAVRLARAYYRHAVREGELRFIGYARAVLSSWWKLESPPVEALVMRANLRQYVHEFTPAVDDLTAVLERRPNHAQALAIRAAISTVRADYAAARADCERLKPLTSELIGFACGATLDGLQGRARASYDELSALLAKQPRTRPEERLWVLTRLAEMAERIGDFDAAERRFRQALIIDPRDQYLLAAYSDFLLERKRPADVVTLLKDRTNAEHLLLRLTLAEKMLGSSSFEVHRQMVEEAFATARRQGHAVHEQEESRFVLHVLNQPERALKLAVSNWQLQRETRDAKALLEAATAMDDARAAAPVLQWLRETGIEDTRLRALARVLDEHRTVKTAQ